jgi:hypothetical protein
VIKAIRNRLRRRKLLKANMERWIHMAGNTVFHIDGKTYRMSHVGVGEDRVNVDLEPWDPKPNIDYWAGRMKRYG